MKKDPVFYDSQCSYYRFVNFAVSVLILIAKQPAPFFTLNFTAVTHYSTIFQIFKYIVSNRLRTLSINQSRLPLSCTLFFTIRVHHISDFATADPSRSGLRSSTARAATTVRTRTKLGDRAFSVAGPSYMEQFTSVMTSYPLTRTIPQTAESTSV